ncbi:MAG: iron ABC transporter permease [Rhodoferax sp.]|nr:iron ABC transporter permease [Rhodoferax sp.]
MNALVLQLRPFLQPRRVHPASLLVGALLLGVVVAIQCGAVPVTSSDWLSVLVPGEQQARAGGAYVLWNIRLPRALFSVLVGASLGLAGALTQGLFRNPLADPGLLGVSAGAACAAALTIVVFSGLNLPIPVSWRAWLLPAAAFGGALGVCFTLDRIARWIAPGSIAGLLLTGVALNALAAAVIGLCTYLATDEQLRSLSFWTLGSLAGGNWEMVVLLASVLLVGGWRVGQLVRAMNALALGESAAAHVGVDVHRLRSHVIVLVAVLAGVCVAWCGMIGFIGLIAPHLVRIWAGADQRRVVPLSMLMGGLLLLVADTLARTVAIPAEIPVGIFTALLGSPFFLLLLRGARGRIG